MLAWCLLGGCAAPAARRLRRSNPHPAALHCTHPHPHVRAALAIYYSETTNHPAPPTLPPTTTIEDWARAQAAAALPACERSSRDLHHQAPVLSILLAWALLTASFQLCCPLEYRPSGWHVPWWAMPWLPSCGVLLVVFRCAAALDCCQLTCRQQTGRCGTLGRCSTCGAERHTPAPLRGFAVLP